MPCDAFASFDRADDRRVSFLLRHGNSILANAGCSSFVERPLTTLLPGILLHSPERGERGPETERFFALGAAACLCSDILARIRSDILITPCGGTSCACATKLRGQVPSLRLRGVCEVVGDAGPTLSLLI
jgi:hypothetical protein